MAAPQLHVYSDDTPLVEAAASRVATLTAQAIDQRGRFTIALAGGSTPRPLYAQLAEPPFRDEIDWGQVHVFWGDERPVPPDHPDSNYRMARLALLDHVPLPPDNIHRMPGELEPSAAAAAYTDQLRAVFGPDLPRFDLIVLGLGTDGHTASLFPHSPALDEKTAWVAANHVAQLASWRLTLTYPVINNARQVMFLVTGEEKAATVYAVLHSARSVAELPAKGVRPIDGDLDWYLDTAVASNLGK